MTGLLTVATAAVSGGQTPKGPSNETISFEWVRRLIETRNLTTLESVIPLLPKSYRQNFTLMKESSSSQGATPLAPRVILFGETAQSILTFNGAPDQRGFNTIEMIDFNDKDRSFEFRQIEFTNGRVRFSEKNPALCMGCHKGRSKELRPNWESYPRWDSAYGADDDFPRGSEVETLKIFKSQRESSERYRHLILEQGSSQSPFSEDYKGHIRFRPNARLTALLARWNARKLVRMMQSHPSYRVYRDLLLFEQVANQDQMRSVFSNLDLSKHMKPKDILEYRLGRLRLLDLIIQEMSFVAADWSMSFGVKKFGNSYSPNSDPEVTYFEGTTTMWKLVENELWRDFISEHPSLHHAYEQDRTFSSKVNSNIAGSYPLAQTIDDIGGAVKSDSLKREDLYSAVLAGLRRDVKIHPMKSPVARTVFCRKAVGP